MKDLGQLQYCLGLEVWRGNGKTLITQIKNRKGLIKKFNMNECKIVSTTLENNVKINNYDEKKL